MIFLGASNTLEDNVGDSQGIKLSIAIAENYYESLLATTTWTTANAYHVGDCGCRNGDFWIDPWQIHPLNALNVLTNQQTQTPLLIQQNKYKVVVVIKF